MYDTGKVVFGIVVFLVLITFPFWFTLALGQPGYRPDPELPAGETRCVESKEYMTNWHMDLLDQWRDAVVREGKRVYVSREHGLRYEMNLTRTCMGCHASREKFCNRCHNYVGVNPYCWDCHVEPKGE